MAELAACLVGCALQPNRTKPAHRQERHREDKVYADDRPRRNMDISNQELSVDSEICENHTIGITNAIGVDLPSVQRRQHKGLNNRTELSQQPTRQRARQLRRFSFQAHVEVSVDTPQDQWCLGCRRRSIGTSVL